VQDLAEFFADVIEFIVGGVLFLASLLLFVSAWSPHSWSTLTEHLDDAPAGLSGGYTIGALAVVYAMGILAEGVSRSAGEWWLTHRTSKFFDLPTNRAKNKREELRHAVKHQSERLDEAINTQLKRLRIERTLALSGFLGFLGFIRREDWFLATALLILFGACVALVNVRFGRYLNTIRYAFTAMNGSMVAPESDPARHVVIFDLDGVLVDSEPYWREAFRAAMDVIAADLGTTAPAMSDEELHEYEGGRVSDTVRTLAAAVFGTVSEETIEHAVEAGIERARTLFAKEPRAISASVETAVELSARGFRLAVASSSAPVFIEAVVERVGLADAVEVMESAFFLENPKPHPDVYLNVVARMGVSSEHCTAIEDSWTGVQAALRAGLRTVWLTEDPVESLKERVLTLRDRDPESNHVREPSLLFTKSLDADEVQEFSEA
jgi:HAD superfamily hydrolase (TIGR01509 family)